MKITFPKRKSLEINLNLLWVYSNLCVKYHDSLSNLNSFGHCESWIVVNLMSLPSEQTCLCIESSNLQRSREIAINRVDLYGKNVSIQIRRSRTTYIWYFIPFLPSPKKKNETWFLISHEKTRIFLISWTCRNVLMLKHKVKCITLLQALSKLNWTFYIFKPSMHINAQGNEITYVKILTKISKIEYFSWALLVIARACSSLKKTLYTLW